MTDSPDTQAVQGTAPYWNKRQPCGCRSVPDGQHVLGCKHNTTSEATFCKHCDARTASLIVTDEDRCQLCGNVKAE